MKRTHLLIIGSGPYGLAAAAYAKHQGVDFLIHGKPMEFWSNHMPKGMFLRSGADWHLDPLEEHTLEAFIEFKGLKKDDVYPIPVELFREYGCWFSDSVGLNIAPSMVKNLESNEGGFDALLDDGSRIVAENVFVAPGFRYFMNVPESLADIIPGHRYDHTCELVDFDSLKGRRCLIVGGRQSAFEWAALIGEVGAEEIHLAYRHDTPRFEPSEWEWVDPLMDLTMDVRGWYRNLPAEERTAIEQRFWAEGRLKLEPWLAPRINKKNVKLWPRCSVLSCREKDNGALTVQLSNGQTLAVDNVLLATGYRADVSNLPYLSRESIVSGLRMNDGFPALDEDLQTSVRGLFMAGLMALKDFGPFYGFVKGCPTAARIIVNRIVDRHKR